MAVSAPVKWYLHGLRAYLAGEADYDANDIRLALASSSYTPTTAHNFWDDVVANEVTGSGYTANGTALGSKTVTVTEPASATAWAATTAYAVGDVRRPVSSNGHLYKAIVAGTSAGSEPTWPTTADLQVVDSGVTWREIGRGQVALSAATVTWTTGDPGTLTARWGVIYNRTPATDATRPLIAYVDFTADQTASNGGALSVSWDARGILRTFAGF